MIVKDTHFGDIQYTEKDLLDLPGGLVGMPQYCHFLVLDFESEHAFKVLQSTDDPDISFMMTDPRLFRPDFDFEGLRQARESLRIEKDKGMVVFVLCTWRESFEATTGNLMGPIVVNARTRQGLQVILEDGRYSIHESLFRAGTEPNPKSVDQSAKIAG